MTHMTYNVLVGR